MIGDVLEVLRQVLFWPGDTLLSWLSTAHPPLAAWLGLQSTSAGGVFAAVVSLMAGWGLFSGICHLMLLVVQRWETRQARQHTAPTSSMRETDTSPRHQNVDRPWYTGRNQA